MTCLLLAGFSCASAKNAWKVQLCQKLTNALIRLGTVGAGMRKTVAKIYINLTTAARYNALAHEWEDNVELLALPSSEHLRMGAVPQAVPKLEGTVTLLKEQGDAVGAIGV
jgi:ABC-type uncharacterized transport system permease subunit